NVMSISNGAVPIGRTNNATVKAAFDMLGEFVRPVLDLFIELNCGDAVRNFTSEYCAALHEMAEQGVRTISDNHRRRHLAMKSSQTSADDPRLTQGVDSSAIPTYFDNFGEPNEVMKKAISDMKQFVKQLLSSLVGDDRNFCTTSSIDSVVYCLNLAV